MKLQIVALGTVITITLLSEAQKAKTKRHRSMHDWGIRKIGSVLKLNSNNVSEEKIVVSIQRSLAERIQKRLGNSSFKTMDDYVAYVLDQVLAEIETQPSQEQEQKVFSQKDQEEVEQRLKDLGYM